MTDPAQVESDAALARRLQEEEFSVHFHTAMSEGGSDSGAFTPNSSSMDVDSDVPPLVDTRFEGLQSHLGYPGGTTRGAPSRNGSSPSSGTAVNFPFPMVRGQGSPDPMNMLSDFMREMARPGVLDTRPGLRDEAMTGLRGYFRRAGPTTQGRDNPPRNNGPRNQDRPQGIPSVLMAIQDAFSSIGQGGGSNVRGGSFTFGPDGSMRVEAQMGGDGRGPSNVNVNAPPSITSPQDMLSWIVSDLLEARGDAGGGAGGGPGVGTGGGPGGGNNRMQTMFRAFFPNVGFEGAETYEDWLSVIERMGGNVNRSATDQEIGNLPTHKVTKNMMERRKSSRGSQAGPSSQAGSSSGNLDEGEKCAICLGDYEEDEEVKTLPCTHMFHTECVDRWLKVNRTCPFCKQSIRSDDRSE